MTMELLREIAQKPLPCTVTEERDIDLSRVLRAAGYVAAFLQVSISGGGKGSVLAITDLGRKALRDDLFTLNQELEGIPKTQKLFK